MGAHGARRRPRCEGEEGVAVIEAALAFPVLFLLLFGVLEFGNLFYIRETLNYATTNVARAAAIQGDNQTADYFIVEAAQESMAQLQQSRIERIVIWKATGPNDSVPLSCTTASVTGLCNTYFVSPHFSGVENDFDCSPNPAPTYGNAWCPLNRDAALGTDGTTDYLGVYIEYEHTWITGIIPGPQTIVVSETKITKLEPNRLL